MKTLKFDCDCDVVVAMEEMGVGVEEILQYAYALVPTHHVVCLLSGVSEILADRRDTDESLRTAA